VVAGLCRRHSIDAEHQKRQQNDAQRHCDCHSHTPTVVVAGA
jgi:hypothetical protein